MLHYVGIGALLFHALPVQSAVDGVTVLREMQLRGIVFFVDLLGRCKLLVNKWLHWPRVHPKDRMGLLSAVWSLRL